MIPEQNWGMQSYRTQEFCYNKALRTHIKKLYFQIHIQTPSFCEYSMIG